MKQYNIAAYVRLSIRDKETLNASNSVRVQQLEINSYIKKTKEFRGANVKTYIDDGYSGTNFNRPQIQELLQDVQDKKVNCVIIKDISRLGRNYIEVGECVEKLFPQLGVRFIMVADNYDSEYEEDSDNLLIAFKALFADYYSKNLSDKVSVAYRRMVLDGKYVKNFAPYGYKKVKENIHVIEIDEPAAEIVRWIYQEYVSGKAKAQIARELNEKQIDSPALYKRKQGINVLQVGDKVCLWSRKTISDILQNEAYIGTYTFGKRKRIKVGSSTTIINNEEQVVICKDAFMPIVDMEMFDLAQAKKVKRPIGTRGESHLYAGLLQCAVCNHVLHRKQKGNGRPYVYCNSRTLSGDFECKDTKLYIDDLNEIVRESIIVQAKVYSDLRKVKGKMPIELELKNDKKALRQHKKKLERYSQSMKELLMNRIDLKISEDAYEKEMKIVGDAMEDLSNEVELLEKVIVDKSEEVEELKKKMEVYKEVEVIDEITKDVLSMFVEKIMVYNSTSIEIVWKFNQCS